MMDAKIAAAKQQMLEQHAAALAVMREFQAQVEVECARIKEIIASSGLKIRIGGEDETYIHVVDPSTGKTLAAFGLEVDTIGDEEP